MTNWACGANMQEHKTLEKFKVKELHKFLK